MVQAMSLCHQLLRHFPPLECAALAKKHNAGRGRGAEDLAPRRPLGSVLPGLANRSIQRVADLTPPAWAVSRSHFKPI